MSSRVSKEVLSIQRAIGEKLAACINAYAMGISGFALGFIQGWSLSLSLLGLAPIIGVGIVLFFNSAANKSVAVLKSYSQSGGYAEQALNAIKVVVSYG